MTQQARRHSVVQARLLVQVVFPTCRAPTGTLVEYSAHPRIRAPAALRGGLEIRHRIRRGAEKAGRLYRYYVTSGVNRGRDDKCTIRRVPAAEIEAAVLVQIKTLVQSPEIIVATWRAAKPHIEGLSEQQVREHLLQFSTLWSELFPAEQARLVQLLVARVQVNADGLDITLRTDGLTSLLDELVPAPDKEAA